MAKRKKTPPKETTPNTVDAALAITPPEDELHDLIVDMNGRVEEAVNNRTAWRHQLETNFQWRAGMVGKKDPNFPFKNSSDIRYRLSEFFIRQQRGLYVSTLWNAPMMVRVTPINAANQDSADRLENYYNYFYRAVIPFRRRCAQLADKGLEAGVAVAKITWAYQCEPRTVVVLKDDVDRLLSQVLQARVQQAMQAQQQGMQPPSLEITDEEVQLAIAANAGIDPDDDEYQDALKEAFRQYKDDEGEITVVTMTTKNQAEVGVIDELQNIIVPVNCGDIAESEWVAHDMMFSERELRLQAIENGGKYKNVAEVLDTVHDAVSAAQLNREIRHMDAVIKRAEGITPQGELKGYVNVRELYCWIPRQLIKRFNGKKSDDKTPVRAVITYCPEIRTASSGSEKVDGTGILRMIEYPYKHGRWPFEMYWYNYSRERFYHGEGVPSIINSMEKEFNTSRNAAIDRNTIALSPPTVIWERSEITPAQFRQVGQAIISRCPPEQAIHMPTFPNLARGFESDAAGVRQWAQEIVGVPNVGPLQGRGEAPTATEVSATLTPSNSMASYEMDMWLEFWGRVFTQVHELHKQYLFVDPDDTVTVPNLQNRREPVRLAKEDFAGDYIVESGADPSSSNPILRAQQRFIGFQSIFNYPEVKALTNMYDVIYTHLSDIYGSGTVQQIMKGRQEGEQALQQLQQAAAAQMANDQQTVAEGGRPDQRRFKQLPNAQNGLVPQSVG